MSIDFILSRLTSVKRNGNQYTAKCPAHADKSPSLSLKDCGDHVLIHCFGGCDAPDVLGAIGLTLADLYAESNLTKTERRHFYESKRRSDNRETLQNELNVLLIAKNALLKGNALAPDDLARVNQACEKIKAIRGGAAC